MRQWTRWCRTVAVTCLIAAPAWAQGSGQGSAIPASDAAPSSHTVVTQEMLLGAQQSGDWLMYGHNYLNNRFSPLNQINATNVRGLVPRMVFQTGIEKLGSFETTPVVVNGVMYATTPYNVAMAYDLRTGKQLWRYEHKLGTTIYCCGPNNRGVAIGNGTVFMATLDAQLVALDQQTGTVKWTK
ncbi:MAG: PQQ-binding-like beta-propeller repeat protein, partial [Gemmatimonadales bacterium]